MVAPETCGIGGDLFALVHRPGWQSPRALNASGRAGSGADPGVLRRAGVDRIPIDHPLTVTAPGCVDGWVMLSELGDLPLASCLEPALRLAQGGFEASTEQAVSFAATAQRYAGHPAIEDLFPGGVPVTAGASVRRPSLAATLQAISESGRDAFYAGLPAEDIVAELGGVITSDDLARPHAEWIEPISCRVAGLSAWTIPPNSVGYLGPATLAVFEMLDPPSDPDSPDWWHLLVESFRCVAWERDDLVSDPAKAPLPASLLLDNERLARAAATVRRDSTGKWPQLGSGAGTAYMCMVDDQGMAVSVIQSNYEGPGSAFGARRSGFLLQNRGAGFTLTPGHPNELAPGKRPLHTLSPTLWTAGNDPRWVIGSRGGGYQPQVVAQVAARAVLAGQSLETTQQAPRWTILDFGPFTPSKLQVEPAVPATISRELRSRGHLIEETPGPQPGWGPVSMIEIDGARLATAPDPRVDTTSAVISDPGA